MKRKTRIRRAVKPYPIRKQRSIVKILTASPSSIQPLPIAALYKAAAGEIVQQIIDHMIVVAAANGKAFSTTAFDEWRPKLHSSVFVNLINGGSWSNDKTNVLIVAGDMATISGLLAGAGNPTISKPKVHAAFRAVKDHSTCPGGAGSGAWCNFDI